MNVRDLPLTRSGLVGELVASGSPSLGELLERGASHGEIRAVVERWLIEGTLARFGGNVTRLAAVLGVSRAALRRRRARSELHNGQRTQKGHADGATGA